MQMQQRRCSLQERRWRKKTGDAGRMKPSDGPSWSPCRSLWKCANPENGGQKWKKHQDWISGVRMHSTNSPNYAELKMIPSAAVATSGLIKDQLSDQLRAEILSGSLKPGERIVEGKWAAKYGVAQASIREALNILAQAGFVTKAPGRSARVIHLSETDVAHIYQLRGAIEGLAARLVAQSRQDLNVLQATMDAMRESARTGDRDRLIDCDLLYHLVLCELSRNPYLIEHARRILVPLFAFVRMRVSASGQSTSAWQKDLEAHQKTIDFIREGESEVAEQYVKRVMERFAKAAYDYWEKREVNAG
jgi:DNA-binding GntR family transcriptional regulator